MGMRGREGEPLLFETAVPALRGENPGGESRRIRGYVPTCFVICPLPVRMPGRDVKEYERKYNQYQLKLTGTNGIPGGKIGRDLLMLFSTEAVFLSSESDGSVNIRFHSIKRLAETIGITRNNFNDKIIDSIERYAGCSIYFEKFNEVYKKTNDNMLFSFMDEEENKMVKRGDEVRFKRIVNVPFIHKFESLEVVRKKLKVGVPVRIDIKLASQFVTVARDHAVPINFSAYKEMGSTLEKDLYVWLVYRNNGFLPNEGLFVSRRNLLDQFSLDEDRGVNNEGPNYFRILEAIKTIKKEYYENLDVEILKGGNFDERGIVLHKSPAVIDKNDEGFVTLLPV